jgi:hypothetical protein
MSSVIHSPEGRRSSNLRADLPLGTDDALLYVPSSRGALQEEYRFWGVDDIAVRGTR